MSDLARNRCMFMGLPNSGKSSFIGALWHVVETGEIESEYSIKTPPENREYLNNLRDAWLECKAPDRTNTDLYKQIVLKITEKSTGKIIDFIFPDVSGEMYESQFEHRKLSKNYLDQIDSSDGIMIFVNPDFLKKSNLISDADKLISEAVIAALLELNNEKSDKKIVAIKPQQSKTTNDTISSEVFVKKYKPWIHKEAQTQVILIDLLQMIINKIRKICKIVVVISAWDLILNSPDDNLSKMQPEEWFSNELPLLKQFFMSNKDIFTYNVFGVSAQGASYKDDVKALHEFPQQSRRIKIQIGEVVSNDITLPIKWLLNG